MYDLDNGTIECRMANNNYVLTLMDFCRDMGRQLKPICMLDVEYSSKYGCLDLITVEFEQGKQYWEGICEYYESELGTVFNLNNLEVVNSICLDYFMRAGMCYVEIKNKEPKRYGQGNVEEKFTTIKDKYLACKNPDILGKLEGLPTGVSVDKYSENYDIEATDINEYLIPYLKVKEINTAGTKLVKCRNRLDITDARMMFLPFISSWLQGLYENIQNSIVRITYIKDDGESRSIDTTLNRDILERVYSKEHVDFMIQSSIRSIEFDEDPYFLPFQGNVQRGWIRLPELGSSAVDDSGVRAVNFSRIVKAEEINFEDVDLTYVNASINKAEQYFYNRINEYEIKSDLNTLKGIYSELQNCGFKDDLKYPVSSYDDIVSISNSLKSFLAKKQYVGTTFKKALHLFMISNPELFPNYIGIHKENTTSIGVEKE